MTNNHTIPFDFVFDYLPPGIVLKKMFGMHYIYLGNRIMLILRERPNEPELNGIWVATGKKYHESLENNIPELSAVSITNDERLGNWLFLKKHAEDFEGAGIKICELIRHGDKRIGRETKKPPSS